MNTWFARNRGTRNVGTMLKGSVSTRSTPGVAPVSVTAVAVPTATTRSRKDAGFPDRLF